jgi:transposase
LRELRAVETLRRIWVQQYVWAESHWRWRTTAEQPPHTELLISPYEPEARYSRKRDTEWCGYKTHLTETCDPDLPRLITNVETGNAAAPDQQMTATSHQHLAAHDQLPDEHYVDSGYLDAGAIVAAESDHAVALLGPVPADTAWQAHTETGYALKVFRIDWEAQQVTCPQGHPSQTWRTGHDARGHPQIQVRFARAHCQAGPVRPQCTRSAARTLSLRPRAQHEALQQRRQVQTTTEFRQAYRTRAGIEGTVSCAVRVTGLRRARYIGHAKTHLQNVATAVALNLRRLAAWWADLRPRGTRTSHFAALQPV